MTFIHYQRKGFRRTLTKASIKSSYFRDRAQTLSVDNITNEVIMNAFSLNEVPCFDRLLGPQPRSQDLLLKILEK